MGYHSKVACIVCLVVCVAGCSKKRAVSFPATGLGGSVWGGPQSPFGDTAASFGVWGDGMAFVIWSDLSDASGGSSTGDAEVVYRGTHTSRDGRKIEFRCTTADGKTGTLTISGKVFSLENGSVFLVSARGDQLTVNQLKQDTLNLKPGQEGLEALAKREPAFEKFFALGRPR